jgi:hypothetical protein
MTGETYKRTATIAHIDLTVPLRIRFQLVLELDTGTVDEETQVKIDLTGTNTYPD